MYSAVKPKPSKNHDWIKRHETYFLLKLVLFLCLLVTELLWNTCFIFKLFCEGMGDRILLIKLKKKAEILCLLMQVAGTLSSWKYHKPMKLKVISFIIIVSYFSNIPEAE